ncbi:MAG: dethiobiotin synthase [Anaerohalosphaeraceae bacterium]
MAICLNLPRKPGLFITGTDTGVGKTLITGAIARLLAEQGLRVGVFKPVASGCRRTPEGLVSTDAEFLAACSQTDWPLEVVNPVAFEIPAAPITCSRLENSFLDYGRISWAWRQLCEQSDAVLVEGIGGAMVPLTETDTVLDLAAEFDLPTLIVARPRLGTINHTLLTIKAVRDAGLPLAGVVISGYNASQADIAEQTSPDVIAQVGQTTVFAVIDYDPQASVEEGRLGTAALRALSIWDWKSLIQC